jgi:hypothetical protein
MPDENRILIRNRITVYVKLRSTSRLRRLLALDTPPPTGGIELGNAVHVRSNYVGEADLRYCVSLTAGKDAIQKRPSPGDGDWQ